MKSPAPTARLLPVAALGFLLLATSCSHTPQTPEQPFHCQEPTLGHFDPLGVTTEQGTILPATGDIYRVLIPCAGWERLTRTDLVGNIPIVTTGEPVALLSLVHLSDVHIVDAESPMRIEFLRHQKGFDLSQAQFQAAFRPQETMTAQVAEAMVQQINSFKRGPVTGRAFDQLVNTGDSGDNHQLNELKRFVDLLNGGVMVTPRSGGLDYEGVQDNAASPLYYQYWHPDPPPGANCGPLADGSCPSGCGDKWYDTYCFRPHPRLLTEVTASFPATGVNLPWYTTYGNHDRLLQGNFAIRPNLAPVGALSSIATSDAKRLQLPDHFRSDDPALQKLLVDAFLLEFFDPLQSPHDWKWFRDGWIKPPTRTVEPDSSRALWSEQDFVQTLIQNPGRMGPVGHGFSAAKAGEEQVLYYTFDLTENPRIKGIVLDTTNPGGRADGSLDPVQVAWLESELQKVSSVYYTPGAERKETGNKDALVVLFSHHNLQTLGNTFPVLIGSDRTKAAGIEKILHRYPNVILWLNGHTHFNRVTPHPDETGLTPGFWEVTAPSLIDFPQMARLIELVDNRNGTLSIFATLIDHAAPADPDSTTGVLRLASLSRQLAANDFLLDLSLQVGSPADRNVELLIRSPFRRTESAR